MCHLYVSLIQLGTSQSFDLDFDGIARKWISLQLTKANQGNRQFCKMTLQFHLRLWRDICIYVNQPKLARHVEIFLLWLRTALDLRFHRVSGSTMTMPRTISGRSHLDMKPGMYVMVCLLLTNMFDLGWSGHACKKMGVE